MRFPGLGQLREALMRRATPSGEQGGRDREAEGLCGLQIYDELVGRRLLDRKIGWSSSA